MINRETLPVDDAREDLATAIVDVFAAVRYRGSMLAGDPVRDPAADRDGRFGWDLADGSVLRLLMLGVELIRVRDDLTAARRPCLYVNGSAWWWAAAVRLIASPARRSASPR